MYALKLVNITKRFPGVLANDHITLEVFPGEIMTVLGENGAGKTTLMNIIFGVYTSDEGEIFVYGKRVKFTSPKDAYAHGIVMVSQTPKLVRSMTILENLTLGLREAGIVLPTKKIAKRAQELVKKYQLQINLNSYVWQLSASEKKRVELLKALMRNPKILILDEPTTSLSPMEKDMLFNFMRKLKEEGSTVLFITHKLSEALNISDRIAVLRRGKLVGVINKEDANEALLTSMMFGNGDKTWATSTVENQSSKYHRRASEGDHKEINGGPILEVRDLYVKNDMGAIAVKGVSFSVYPNEILGIAGVAGNGQVELIEAIIGVRKVKKGKIIFRVNGKTYDFSKLSIRSKLDLGLGIIPEDRFRHGIAPDLSVAENLILRYYHKRPFSDGIMLNMGYIMKWANEMIQKFEIATPGPEKPVRFLSGGNVQRIIVARELNSLRKFIIAAYPTFGLDVRSAEFVRQKLIEQKNQGAGILLLSEDLDELLKISDRIAVIYEGEIKGIFSAENVNVNVIAKLMVGG